MHVTPYTPTHLDAAIWDSSEEFERIYPRLLWHLHTSYAHAWCVERYEEVVGVSAAIRFGDQARLTVCKPVSGYDKSAVRTLLVNAMRDELRADGCTGFTITAALQEQAMWEALGFTAQEQLLRYTGGRFFEGTSENVVWLEPRHRLGVLHLDKRASGCDRTTLLMEHAYLGRVLYDGNNVRGVALATLGDALIVANDPGAGLELQRFIFPTQEHLCIPAGNAPAHEHLLERGYTASIAGVRMTCGEVPPYRPELIYAEPFGAV